jgi:chromosome segregation ATPase
MKYTEVKDLPLYSSIQFKTGNMENTTEQLQPGVTGGEAAFEAEKRELCERIELLDKAFRQLESENKLLLDQLRLNHTPGDEKEILVNNWREEIRVLNEKVAEQGWLKDVVEEKNSQIGFLQAQLEQRIKQYHQSERHRAEIENGIHQERQELELLRSETRKLRDEMAQLQQGYVRIEESLEEKEQLMADRERTIGFQQDQLIYAGNQLQEIRQQNELLNAAVSDGMEKIEALDRHLLQEQAVSAAAEQKLLANRQLLQRLYKELTACIREGEIASPVVALHPSYIISDDERDEMATS